MTALHAAVALLAALHQRTATGVGQHIDLSMLAAVAATDDHAHAVFDGTGEAYSSRGTIWAAPGGPLLIAAPPKHAWSMLSRAGLVTDPAPPGADLPTKFRLRQQAIQDWISGFGDRTSCSRRSNQPASPGETCAIQPTCLPAARIRSAFRAAIAG
jgi:CoA-transferase family III